VDRAAHVPNASTVQTVPYPVKKLVVTVEAVAGSQRRFPVTELQFLVDGRLHSKWSHKIANRGDDAVDEINSSRASDTQQRADNSALSSNCKKKGTKT
jgi:hypothetical protein